jgi:hypothetical protein
MTPTWAVILVGIGGALFGSLFATLLTISHERAAELRAHMLNAADEFSTGAIKALQEARIAAGQIRKDTVPLIDPGTGWYRKEIETHLDSANQAVNDVLAKQARVHLLFGDQSPAGVAATGVGTELRNMGGTLEERLDSVRDHNTMAAYSRYFDGAREQHERSIVPRLSPSTKLGGSGSKSVGASGKSSKIASVARTVRTPVRTSTAEKPV